MKNDARATYGNAPIGANLCSKLISLTLQMLALLDHETAIMHRLQSIILEHTNVLMKVMEYTAELDW